MGPALAAYIRFWLVQTFSLLHVSLSPPFPRPRRTTPSRDFPLCNEWTKEYDTSLFSNPPQKRTLCPFCPPLRASPNWFSDARAFPRAPFETGLPALVRVIFFLFYAPCERSHMREPGTCSWVSPDGSFLEVFLLFEITQALSRRKRV